MSAPASAEIPSPPADAPPARQPDLRLVAFNLACLIALGVGVSAWLLFYTEWFPVFGGLLGLGGLFAWIAFLSNLIPEETKKGLQAAFQERALARKDLGRQLLNIVLVLLIPVLCLGTIKLDATAESLDRVVAIHPVLPEWMTTLLPQPMRNWITGTEVPQWRFLPARGTHKRVLPVTPFGYRLRTQELPAQILWVFPLWRRTVDVPGWFERLPVVFVRPDGVVSQGVASGDFGLQVCIEDEEQYCTPAGERYNGGVFWLGASTREAAIPGWLKDEIDRESAGLTGVKELWLTPWSEPSLETLSIKEGQDLAIYVVTSDGRVHAVDEQEIGPLRPSQPWPHRIELVENTKKRSLCKKAHGVSPPSRCSWDVQSGLRDPAPLK